MGLIKKYLKSVLSIITPLFRRILLGFIKITKKKLPVSEKWLDYKSFKEYQGFAKVNENISYSVSYREVPKINAKHKYVGAQYEPKTKRVYAIPNDASSFMKITEDNLEFIGDLGDNLFKWTGGCLYNGCLYAFPRTSNSMLCLNLETNKISFPFSYDYKTEHHYGGVCTSEGVVYQPPRRSNHILATNLNTGKIRHIKLVPDFLKMDMRYCGSLIHPNGYIYFFPENGYVIKLDPKTEQWGFIGSYCRSYAFDAKVGIDGSIYAFSAYGKGLMKVDVISEKVEMFYPERHFGVCGTKVGVNGRLYAIPGDGEIVYEFNVTNGKLSEIHNCNDSMKAKFAGGVTLKDGRILGMPADANRIIEVNCDKAVTIPDEIYDYFCGFY